MRSIGLTKDALLLAGVDFVGAYALEDAAWVTIGKYFAKGIDAVFRSLVGSHAGCLLREQGGYPEVVYVSSYAA